MHLNFEQTPYHCHRLANLDTVQTTMDAFSSRKRYCVPSRAGCLTAQTAVQSHPRGDQSVDAKRTSSRCRSRSRSRARTSTARLRTNTGTATQDDVYLVALIENRAKEVGLAAYNFRSFHIELRQFADTNCFSTLMTFLTIFQYVIGCCIFNSTSFAHLSVDLTCWHIDIKSVVVKTFSLLLVT